MMGGALGLTLISSRVHSRRGPEERARARERTLKGTNSKGYYYIIPQ